MAKPAWVRPDKIAFWGLVVATVSALSGVVFGVLQLGGGGGVKVGTNNGTINSGTVNNLFQTSDDPSGPSVVANSCRDIPPSINTAQVVNIDLYVRQYKNGECWSTSVAPGITPSTLEFEIRYANASSIQQNDVVISFQLAKGLTVVPGRTFIKNSAYPTGVQIDTDAVVANGIVIGSYAPGAAGYVAFEVQTPALGDLKCGDNLLRSIAYATPKSVNYFYNTADVNLYRHCASPTGSGAS